ncbi:hypothetical protein E2562_007108 [Oryza meyeriana var. granulata]|uniref:Uncharacterized protein n=1 Tax=Oryza meyeriana var. granulata TaxID=110450 RepID=A0A6G1F4X4_9ORYZ|nr:hypothetical protein E2562_007108 [Oryza meyeriana var. granulata]
MADKGVSKASMVVAAAAWLLLLLIVLAADAAAAPAGEAAAAWRRLEDSVEMEPLPAELDRVQRRVLATETDNGHDPLDQNKQVCISNCLPGREYTLPPPGSHCDRKYYNPGC